jgi:cytochrome c553
MRNFKILLAFVAFSFFIACGGGNQKTETTSETPAASATETPAADATSYDPKRGEGKFDETNVKVDATLNATMAAAGEKAAGVKCTSCHKMTDERLVGPGMERSHSKTNTVLDYELHYQS